MTASSTTSQLSLVEQGRSEGVEDIHIELLERGLHPVAYVRLTQEGVSLTGWEDLSLEIEMTPAEKLRWLHVGMASNLEAGSSDADGSKKSA